MMKNIFAKIFFVSLFWILFLTPLKIFCASDYEEDYSIFPIVGKLYFYKSTGESLYALASKFQVGVSHLVKANILNTRYSVKSDTNLIIPRRRVLPFQLADGLVLNLPEFTVYIFKKGKLIDFFPVAVGRPSMPTPVGDYQLISKVKWPTWMPPVWAGINHPVPPGPGNPLGKYWIGTSAPGVGLHSTTSPGSIGYAVSHGCIRNYPWLASKLFDYVEIGMPLKIMYKPIKFGFDKGKLYVEVHPDIYYHHRKDKAEYLQQILQEIGLAGIVDFNYFEKIVEKEKGYPVVILNNDFKVKRGNKFLKFDYPVIKKSSEIFMEISDFAKNFLFKFKEKKEGIILSSTRETLEINLDNKTIYLQKEKSLNFINLLNVGNKTYLPLKYLSVSLGFKIKRSKKDKIVLVL